jgi:hypothetical protein
VLRLLNVLTNLVGEDEEEVIIGLVGGVIWYGSGGKGLPPA